MPRPKTPPPPPDETAEILHDDLLDAIVDTLDTLDVYLMANWDEHTRKRLRRKAAHVYRLLRVEQRRRGRGHDGP